MGEHRETLEQLIPAIRRFLGSYPDNNTSLKNTVRTRNTGHDRSFFRAMTRHYVVANAAHDKKMVNIPDSPGFCGKFLFAKIEKYPILELTNVNG